MGEADLSGRGRSALTSRFFWSIGSFASSYGLRFASNIILTRLLDPHVFGIMVVVNALRLGVELLTDVGIEQNIVRNDQGLDPDFLNTAWTIQITRGGLLTSALLLFSPLLARLYAIDVSVFAAIAFAPLLNALHSTSVFVLVRNLDVKARTLFELRSEAIGFAITVTLALITPTVWALVAGTLLSIAVRSALSYRLPHPAHRPILHRSYTAQILRLGGWMFVSSLLLYAGTNTDRLSLGNIAPLAMLGVYGLARTIADVPPQLAGRLSYQILLPLFTAAKRDGELDMASRFAAARRPFVFLCAVGVGSGIAWADWAVKILYDPRYYDAEWMLALLLVGGWFTVLAHLNEAVVLASSGPAYNAAANLMRLIVVATGLPIGYALFGFPGAIFAVVLSELGRLLALGAVQLRIRFSFWRQDVLSTVVMIAVCAAWLGLRDVAGLGEPWRAWVEALSRK